MKINHKNT